MVSKVVYEDEKDNNLVKEVEQKIADESGYKNTEDISAEIQECPNDDCDNTDFIVFQCDTGIWEIWAKCPKCGTIFCMGTE